MYNYKKYDDLYNELRIEYYYLIDLRFDLIQKTMTFLRMYLEKEEDKEQHTKASNVYDCLSVYSDYGVCFVDMSRLVELIQLFFKFGQWFDGVIVVSDEQMKIDKHINREQNRNLKNEITNLNKQNRELRKELEGLENKKIGVHSIATDKWRLEPNASNSDKIIKIMEQQDEITKCIDFNNRLIEHLKEFISDLILK